MRVEMNTEEEAFDGPLRLLLTSPPTPTEEEATPEELTDAKDKFGQHAAADQPPAAIAGMDLLVTELVKLFVVVVVTTTRMEALQTVEAIVFSVLLLFWWCRPPFNKMAARYLSPRGVALRLLRPSCIPGPMALPVLGTSWVYTWLGGYTFSRVHEFYRDMLARHGPVLREEAVWNVPVVSVFARRDIEKVLRASSKHPIRPPTAAIAHYRRSRPDRYASTGIVNEQGEMWAHLRAHLTADLTSAKTIGAFLPELDSIAGDFCRLIRAARVGRQGVIAHTEELASRLGLEAICCLVLGRRMGFLRHHTGEADVASVQDRLAAAVARHFVACRDTYYGLPLWKLYATPAYRQLARSEQQIYDLVLEIIRTASADRGCAAILRSVLAAHVDPREKTAAIVDFIAAGIYTMRNSLVFLLDSIARHPRTQTKLLDDAAYLRACINETFRLMPTAFCLARVTQQDLDVSSGHTLPAGSVVLCQTGIACRNDANFYKANEFIPERWLGEEKHATSSAATFLVIPFGVGRRMCPGKRFIEQSLPVILRHIVREFVVDVAEDMQVQFEFLLAPKAPVRMHFSDRRPQPGSH